MMERSITEVAIFKYCIGKVGFHKVCVLQITPYKTGSFQFHLSKKGVGQQTIMEFHRQAEAVAEAEVDACHFAIGEQDIQPRGITGFY